MPHGHCSPQGPGQGAAACPNFPKEHVQDHLATTLLPLRPPLGLPAGYMAAWLFGAVLPPRFCHPGSSTPLQTTQGVSVCLWLDLSF